MSETPFHGEGDAGKELRDAAIDNFNDNLSQRILKSDPNKLTFASSSAHDLTLEFETIFTPLSPDAQTAMQAGLTKIVFAFTESGDHSQTLTNDDFTELMTTIAQKAVSPHKNPQAFSETLNQVANHLLAISVSLSDVPLEEKVKRVTRRVMQDLYESPQIKKRSLNPITLLQNFLKKRK